MPAVLTSGGQKLDRTALESKLNALTEEISAGLAQLDGSQSREVLESFVSALYLQTAKAEQQKMRRRRQAEGIAAAKERGVRFGRERLTLPSGFEAAARLWHEGGISASSAAGELGMSRDTFLRRAKEYCENELCVP